MTEGRCTVDKWTEFSTTLQGQTGNYPIVQRGCELGTRCISIDVTALKRLELIRNFAANRGESSKYIFRYGYKVGEGCGLIRPALLDRTAVTRVKYAQRCLEQALITK